MNRHPGLRLLALASAIAACSASADPLPMPLKVTPPARSTPMGSTFVAWDALRFRYTPVGLYCPVFDDPTPTLEKMEVHVTTLRPGMASHAPHRHPWEEMIVVKEGQVEVSINGTRQAAGPGSLVFFASNDLHNLTNAGSAPATYFVVNFYSDRVRSAADRPAAERAPAGLLRSCVIACDRLASAPTATGRRTAVLDSPTLTFLGLESHVTTLGPGEATPSRGRDPGDELFIFKSGAAEATVNGVAHRAEAGSLCYVAPNDERTVRNIGAGPCTYQVIRVATSRTPPAM